MQYFSRYRDPVAPILTTKKSYSPFFEGSESLKSKCFLSVHITIQLREKKKRFSSDANIINEDKDRERPRNIFFYSSDSPLHYGTSTDTGENGFLSRCDSLQTPGERTTGPQQCQGVQSDLPTNTQRETASSREGVERLIFLFGFNESHPSRSMTNTAALIISVRYSNRNCWDEAKERKEATSFNHQKKKMQTGMFYLLFLTTIYIYQWKTKLLTRK